MKTRQIHSENQTILEQVHNKSSNNLRNLQQLHISEPSVACQRFGPEISLLEHAQGSIQHGCSHYGQAIRDHSIPHQAQLS